MDEEILLGVITEGDLRRAIINGNSLDTSFALSTGPDPLDITIDLSGYVLDLNVNEDPQKVNYASTINIPSDEEVSLTFDQKIDINNCKLYIDINYNFNIMDNRQCITGNVMFIYQALASLDIWFNKKLSNNFDINELIKVMKNDE